MSRSQTSAPRRRSRKAGLLRRIALPALGLAFASGSVWVVGSAVGMRAALSFEKGQHAASVMAETQPVSPGVGPRVSVVTVRSGAATHVATVDPEALALADVQTAVKPQPEPAREARQKPAHMAAARPAKARKADPFDAVVKQAALSPEKVAKAFSAAGLNVAKTDTRVAKTLVVPSPERFAPVRGSLGSGSQAMLAFADPSPRAESGAIAALSVIAPLETALPDEVDVAPADGQQPQAAVDPDFQPTPDETPLPDLRPGKPARDEAKAAPDDDEPAAAAAKSKQDDDDEADQADEAPEKPRVKAEKPAVAVAKPAPVVGSPMMSSRATEHDQPTRLAYARPDKPGEKSDGLFNNFLNKPKAGGGVAVYDISAAKVYMPDGSVLEAHSGIGEMADNPRYVQHKMRGPTPPHTYNLQMREKLFHGVQAIRMLPVDGKNKYGRNGFLTHSYLLRGGRAESHGCVAFKDYSKFLNAFKQGKVRQLVVVPGNGKGSGVRVAKNGRDA